VAVRGSAKVGVKFCCLFMSAGVGAETVFCHDYTLARVTPFQVRGSLPKKVPRQAMLARRFL